MALTRIGENDEGFSRFYSAFENILYKLSAPLAFAGLPLAADDSNKTPEHETAPARKANPRRESQGLEPDLTKFISRAALRASSRDGHSTNDSFYVVPTAGGTVSYARILSFAEKEKRRLAASMHSENPELFSNVDDEDDFVDARETPISLSPTASRAASFKWRNASDKELANKVEELGMENQSLKDCIDKLTKRLQAFEMSAQQSSMALHESIRLARDMSPVREREHKITAAVSDRQTRTHSEERAAAEDTFQRRVLQLEERVHTGAREIEKLTRENEKLKSVVARYRERWEKLKEGAKTRREGSTAGGNDTAKKDPQSFT